MKKLLLMIMVLTAFGFGIAEARSVDLEATTSITIQTDRDYEFDALGVDDVEMSLESTVATVGVDIGIGNLTLSPCVGVWDSEMEIDSATLKNSSGLALGLGAEYLIASPVVSAENVLDISLVADYLFGDSEVDEIEIGSMSIELPIKNDINRHDIFCGVKASYDALPLDGTVSLALGYSHSEIDWDVSGIEMNMESTGLSIRPSLSISPIEGLTIDVSGAFVDQIAGQVKVAYVF